MGMSLDDAATLAIGSPTIAPPTTTPKSVDDAAALAIGQTNASAVTTVKNNVFNASAVPADTAAANQNLARQANVPVETAAANTGTLSQQVAAQSIPPSLAETHPATTAFLSDPNNAAIAHDDLPNLMAIEKALVGQPTVGGGLWASFGAQAVKSIEGVKAMVADATGDASGLARALSNTKYANAYEAANTPQFDSKVGSWTYQGVSGLLNAVPALASMLTPAGPLGTAAIFGAQQGTGAYGKYRERGAGPGMSSVGAGLESAITVGTSFIPMSFLSNTLGKVGAGEFLTGLLARNIPAMEAQALATSAVDTAIANPQTTWGDWVKSLPEQTGQVVTGALIQSATFGAVHGVMTKMTVDHVKAQEANGVAETMTKVNDLIAASKVAQRAQETGSPAFSDFVAKATENSPVQDVYIDPKVLAQTVGEQMPQLMQQLPEVEKQLGPALASGTDIRIPVGDFASKLGGTDFAKALIPHLKVDPEGFSQIEAQQFLQTHGEDMQAQIKEVLTAKAQDEVFQTSLGNVQDNLLDQLTKANRFTPDVNRPYAQLAANFYATMADRAGMTPEEMFKQYPLKIQAEGVKGGFDQNTSAARLGAFNPQNLTISVMKGANLSTFLHESGHFFLHAMTEMSNHENAPDPIKADAQKLMEWFGVKDAKTWQNMSLEQQRPFHEQFARSFEKYLLDGKAPSLELQSIFSRFRSWLLNVYKSASDFLTANPEAGAMSDEVRGVFDRMLATDDQIGKAQAARGMEPLFKNAAEAKMSEKEFEQYHEQNTSATSTSTSELDARRLRDMQYASNARNEAIKALQREAATKRAAIREEVTREVQSEPIYKAELEIERNVKLSKEGLREIGVPDEIIARMGSAKLTTDEGGLHPDAAAELFGFNSGQGLVEALSNAEPIAEKIKGMTDQRMLERHGDLTDPVSIARAADAAIHNDVRAKVIATELGALNKQLGNKTLLTAAAKEMAAKVVAQLPANRINPSQYIAAAAKAAKAADKAFKAGDLKEAAEQKKNQLINQYAVKAAYEQKTMVDKGLTFLKRFDLKNFREGVAGPYLEQIDALLDKYDFRKNPSSEPNRAQVNLSKWVESQRNAGFEPYVPDFILTGDKMHYGDMSVEQFRGLVDTVRSMKFMADNLKEVTIAGQKMAVESAVQELLKPMQERGDKFTKEELLNPPQLHVDNFLTVALHKIATTLRLIDADLKPQEYKRNEYDLHELAGPFGRLLFEPMFERNYWKVQQLKEVSTKFGEYGAKLGKEWQKSLYNLVNNKTLLDPDLSTPEAPVMMKITRAKMLGIARHVGNESNFDKLTRGYNWNPTDVWNFLHENMTEKDWQATQAQWGIFEKYWPEIENMSRRLGGVPPDKIPLRPFDTKFGKLEGGYAPIDYDPIRSKLSDRSGDVMAEPHEQIGQEPAYKATTTFNGSMQNRQAGYTDRVNLDYHATEQRLRDTIHDLAYREVLIDTNKMIMDSAFKSQFLKTFGREDYKGLQTWMRGIRDMNRNESQMRGFEKFFQYARTGVVMTGIAYRLSTVLKHGSSAALKSLGYLGDASGAKYFAARAARMATGNAQEDIAGAMQKFPEIASRMNQMDRDYKVGTNSMYHAEDWRAKNDRFGHAMVAWSDMLTAVPTAWAAYDRATIEGIPTSLGGTGKPMAEASAIAYANKVVREAHGTALEANRSLFMQARGIKGLFGTIYGFMNNTYGQLGDLMDKTVVGGHFQNKPAIVARAMATLIAPALMAAWVSEGTPNKDNKENPLWWSMKAIMNEVAGTVPFVREAANAVNYARHGDMKSAMAEAAQNPVFRIAGDVMQSAADVYKVAQGKSSRVVSDVANALGELFHIGGLGQAGKSLQYLEDVHTGKQNPKSLKDFATGVTIGPPPKH